MNIDGNGKSSPGLKNFNLGNGHCVSVAQSGDKSEIINSFELRKVAGRVGGMG